MIAVEMAVFLRLGVRSRSPPKAQEFNIAVVLTNQVMADPGRSPSCRSGGCTEEMWLFENIGVRWESSQ